MSRRSSKDPKRAGRLAPHGMDGGPGGGTSLSVRLPPPSHATYPTDGWVWSLSVVFGAFFLCILWSSPSLGPDTPANLSFVGLVGFTLLVFGGMAADPFVPHRATEMDVEGWGIRLRFRKWPSDYLSKVDRWGPKEFRWDEQPIDVTVTPQPAGDGGWGLRTLRGDIGGYRVVFVLSSEAVDALQRSAQGSRSVSALTGSSVGEFAIRRPGGARG